VETYNRRTLLCAAAAGGLLQARSQQISPEARMRLGIILGVSGQPEAAIKRVYDLGFPTCQVTVQDTRDDAAANLRRALDQFGVEVTSAVCTGPGPEVYDFYQGPLTIGLAPRQYRQRRIARMKQVSDFAAKARIPAVQGHCGFVDSALTAMLGRRAAYTGREATWDELLRSNEHWDSKIDVEKVV
jgi:sugar phosphate isomerase/epimerase